MGCVLKIKLCSFMFISCLLSSTLLGMDDQELNEREDIELIWEDFARDVQAAVEKPCDEVASISLEQESWYLKVIGAKYLTPQALLKRLIEAQDKKMTWGEYLISKKLQHLRAALSPQLDQLLVHVHTISEEPILFKALIACLKNKPGLYNRFSEGG